MEDESDEWMNEEYYSPSLKEPSSSNLEWILNTGYGLGKKVAITGFVISSAPIVLPPLVVISALGFACSVPFGLFYASYACTNKIMSKLLSSPDSTLIHEFEMYSSDEEKEELAGFEGGVIELDENGELGVDGLKYADEYWSNDVDDYVNKSMEFNEESEKEERDVEDVGEYSAEEERNEEGDNEEILVEVTKVVLVEESNVVMGDEEEDEIASESTGLLEKIRDGSQINDGVKESTYTDKQVNEEPFDDKCVLLDNRDHGHNIALEIKEMNKEARKEPIDDETTFLENLDDSYNGDIETKEVNEEVNKKPIDDMNALSKNLDDGHSTNSPIRSNEVLLSEEKLWRQIDALRAIVGYEGKRDSTLIAELKALYIFSGVEPPKSFKDPHDLVELDEKLRILMYVVGVK